jgi:hypothetical protein
MRGWMLGTRRRANESLGSLLRRSHFTQDTISLPIRSRSRLFRGSCRQQQHDRSEHILNIENETDLRAFRQSFSYYRMPHTQEEECWQKNVTMRMESPYPPSRTT